MQEYRKPPGRFDDLEDLMRLLSYGFHIKHQSLHGKSMNQTLTCPASTVGGIADDKTSRGSPRCRYGF